MLGDSEDVLSEPAPATVGSSSSDEVSSQQAHMARRELDAKVFATWTASSACVCADGACRGCAAWPQQRLRNPSDEPAGRQTHGSPSSDERALRRSERTEATRARQAERCLQKRLQAMRDHILQGRQRGELYRQLSKLLRPSRGPGESQNGQNGCMQTQAHSWETFRRTSDRGTREPRGDPEEGGLGSASRGVGRAARASKSESAEQSDAGTRSLQRRNCVCARSIY